MRTIFILLFIQLLIPGLLCAQVSGSGMSQLSVMEDVPGEEEHVIYLNDTIANCPGNWIIHFNDDTISGMFFQYAFDSLPDGKTLADFKAYENQISLALGPPVKAFIDSAALYRGAKTRNSSGEPLITRTWATKHGKLKLGIYFSGNNPIGVKAGDRGYPAGAVGWQYLDYYYLWINCKPGFNPGVTKEWKLHPGMSLAEYNTKFKKPKTVVH